MTNPGSKHLTNDQFVQLALGEAPDPIGKTHLATCRLCRDELETFMTTVGSFNTASLGWSETQSNSLRAVETPKRWSAMLVPAGWALAAAILLAGGSQVWNGTQVWNGSQSGFDHDAISVPETASAPAQDSQDQIAQDNHLLQSVNIALTSREVSPLPEYRLANPDSGLPAEAGSRNR